MEKSILEMVGGKKHINPHYNIKVEKMDKDEMKNRISMALKDPILQQGFEIICKNLAELEVQNEEMKSTLERMKSALERWYNQHSDKSYTETFYVDLITDTEMLLWMNCEK